jgi:hypothetical protein
MQPYPYAPYASPQRGVLAKPSAWAELALTLPVFLAYQVGVVFLGVRNAADVVTGSLLELVHGDRLEYLALTGGIGLGTVIVFAVLGRHQALRPVKLLQIALEGALYAVAMGAAASWVVGKLFAGPRQAAVSGPVSGVVMSLGAGYYEEIAFRVLLFGLGARLLLLMFSRRSSQVGGPATARPDAGGGAQGSGLGAIGLTSLWAVASAAVFSGVHYVGVLGDPFDARSFVARGVLGLALTLVYATRGFAAAVWTHALYDIWVLVL